VEQRLIRKIKEEKSLKDRESERRKKNIQEFLEDLKK